MKIFTSIDQKKTDFVIMNRLNEMESPQYQFPKRFSKKDYIISTIVGIGCLFMIFIGYYV